MFDSVRMQKKDDFQVTVTHSTFSDEWNKAFSARVGRVDINLVDRTVEIKVHQQKSGMILDIIFVMINEGGNLDHLSVRPAKSAKRGYEYVFSGGHLMEHHCEFNYGKKEDHNHWLKFKFEQVSLKSPTLDKRKDITLTEPPKHNHSVPRQVLMENYHGHGNPV